MRHTAIRFFHCVRQTPSHHHRCFHPSGRVGGVFKSIGDARNTSVASLNWYVFCVDRDVDNLLQRDTTVFGDVYMTFLFLTKILGCQHKMMSETAGKTGCALQLALPRRQLRAIHMRLPVTLMNQDVLFSVAVCCALNSEDQNLLGIVHDVFCALLARQTKSST